MSGLLFLSLGLTPPGSARSRMSERLSLYVPKPHSSSPAELQSALFPAHEAGKIPFTRTLAARTIRPQPTRMRKAAAVAAAYREEYASCGYLDGGYVILWRLKAVGWCAALDRPAAYRPGVLAVANRGAQVFEARGGDYEGGAKSFIQVFPSAPTAQVTLAGAT